MHDCHESATTKLNQRYAPFDNLAQWELARFALFPQPLSGPRMAQAILENQAPWITRGFGFKNIADFQQRVSSIPTLGGGWRSAYVVPGVAAEDWVPVEILFWMRDALAVVKDLIGDETLAKDMKWAPEKLYNSHEERLYSELYSGDWMWDIQVHSTVDYKLKSRKRSTPTIRGSRVRLYL